MISCLTLQFNQSINAAIAIATHHCHIISLADAAALPPFFSVSFIGLCAVILHSPAHFSPVQSALRVDRDYCKMSDPEDEQEALQPEDPADDSSSESDDSATRAGDIVKVWDGGR